MKENDEDDIPYFDGHKIMIVGLGEFNHDQFMEVFYHVIENAPQEILSYEEDPHTKIEKLNHILRHYEELEQYERCLKIKEVQQMIKDLINEN